MVKFITSILDNLWDLKILKGHRSQIAEYGGMLVGLVLAYQGLINEGSTLPVLPAQVLMVAGVLGAFLAKKAGKFNKEHGQ